MRQNIFQAIGKSVPRKDGVAKVTGRIQYASDVSLPNMLHARILKSPYPHAKVKEIDISEAEKIGAVCLTFKDVPKIKYNERLVSVTEATYKDRMVLTDNPLYVGEPIAAVAAETEEKAQEALELIKVKYEVRKHLLDPIEAMKPSNPLLHKSIFVGDKEIKIRNNIACELEINEGDIGKGFKEADAIIEREYKTNRRYHTQLETKAVICRPEPDGGITVWCTTQSIHNTRILLHEIFGIPLSKINVKKTALGGSFGSSIQTNTIVPICVALALKAKRPVKLVYTREEDMHDHCSYQMILKLKLGAKKNGLLTAGKLELIMDIGAHQIQAYPLLGCAAGWWVSLYKLPNLSYRGIAVYTNKVPCCAMRGFGNPQVTWAVETLMDELAEKLNIDPLNFKLKNHIGLGDMFWGQGPTVKSIIKSSGVEEILKKGAEFIGWYNRPKPNEQKGRIRKGVGMARGFHTSGAGGPTYGSAIDYSGATVKVNEDGTIDYITALMDCGEVTLDAHAKIVAEELGVPLENVNIVQADTQTTVYDVCTHASRGTYVGGGAALKAAKQVKKELLKKASQILNVYPESLRIKPDKKLKQGVIYVEGMPEKRITIKELASLARERSLGTFAATVSLRQTSCPPHFTVFFVEVEVDTETGLVKPIRVVAGADVGTVINPKLAEGQIHGGFAMGLSMALLEDTVYDAETGDLLNKGFLTDYKVPTATDLPSIENFKIFFAHTSEPTGPFGAKGLGEGATNPVAAAVTNAIYNAIGIRFYELPITPERIVKALKRKEGGNSGYK